MKIAGAGSSGNNDARTAERSRRSGRVIQALWHIVANAAIRTDLNKAAMPATGEDPVRWERQVIVESEVHK